MRKEIDALGEFFLPDNAYYGVQTERAIRNFSISGQKISHYPKFLWCLAAIKKSAALANQKVGFLKGDIAGAICMAADEIMDGKMKEQFPVDIFQGGGETSANMNMNEVLANRANEILTGQKGYDLVHPNSHVNMCQSTNDVIPSAVKMACYLHLIELESSIGELNAVLRRKTREFKDVVMVARTCLQDAVPITLGQEFSGYLSFIRRQGQEVQKAADSCLDIPLGATAVGTGLGIFPGYKEAVYCYLPEVSGIPVRKDKNFFDGLQNGDVYVRVSAVLKSLATGLAKIAGDFRILSSGPRGGIGEIELPAAQPGSSIMPGKINPVIPEMIMQVCYQVCGHDLSVTMAVEGGELDLNVWESLIMKCLFESCKLLNNSMRLFADRCIAGIKVNRETCLAHAEASIALVTALVPIFGYQMAVNVAQSALAERATIKETVIEMGLLNNEEANELLNPMNLTDSKKYSQLLQYIERRKA
jgi:aspartate ammonia-lyase